MSRIPRSAPQISAPLPGMDLETEDPRPVAPTSPYDDSLNPDFTFDSENIFSLNTLNFDKFTKCKEKALVLFYDSRKCTDPSLERQFAQLADRISNDKYGFGAVDCFLDSDMCAREQDVETPMLKLYSYGFDLSTLRYLKDIDANQMHMLMRMTPVLAQPRVELGKLAEEVRAPKQKKRFGLF